MFFSEADEESSEPATSPANPDSTHPNNPLAPSEETQDPPTVEPCAEACGSSETCVDGLCIEDGELRISLVWDLEIDLDLWVRTPSGEEVYFGNREGRNGGVFLKDGCLTDRCSSETGPFIESVMWANKPPTGTYEIWAENYDGGESVNFRVEVIQGGETRETFNGAVGAQEDAKSPTYAVCIGENVADRSCPTSTPEDTDTPAATCLKELDRLGVPWEPWGYSTQEASGKTCDVNDPIRIRGDINGVAYRYYNADSPSSMSMSCELALALYELGDVLGEHAITDVRHIGTFNCRTIAGTTTLSQHAHGYAIDLYGFEDSSGASYVLEDHWEHDTDTPQTMKGKVLYDIAHTMHDRKIFNTVLTPNYNAGHDNHFHVDLKPGGDYLGYYLPEYYIGNDLDEACPGE